MNFLYYKKKKRIFYPQIDFQEYIREPNLLKNKSKNSANDLKGYI